MAFLVIVLPLAPSSPFQKNHHPDGVKSLGAPSPSASDATDILIH